MGVFLPKILMKVFYGRAGLWGINTVIYVHGMEGLEGDFFLFVSPMFHSVGLLLGFGMGIGYSYATLFKVSRYGERGAERPIPYI